MDVSTSNHEQELVQKSWIFHPSLVSPWQKWTLACEWALIWAQCMWGTHSFYSCASANGFTSPFHSHFSNSASICVFHFLHSSPVGFVFVYSFKIEQHKMRSRYSPPCWCQLCLRAGWKNLRPYHHLELDPITGFFCRYSSSEITCMDVYFFSLCYFSNGYSHFRL